MELNFQFGHHAWNESESQPIESANAVLAAFDEFDWISEIAKANETQEISPTLSLILNENDHLIWVSGYGEPEKPRFFSNCRFPGQVPGFLGFGKKHGIVDLHADSFTKAQARRALELFASERLDELREHYK